MPEGLTPLTAKDIGEPKNLVLQEFISAIKDALAKRATMDQILADDKARYSQLLDEALQK